jgi:hypothetical protein
VFIGDLSVTTALTHVSDAVPAKGRDKVLQFDSSEPDSCDLARNGVMMTTTFSYPRKVGGLERDNDYSYTRSDSKCKFDKSKVVASVHNFSVVSMDEGQIAANLIKHGTLASKRQRVCLNIYNSQ